MSSPPDPDREPVLVLRLMVDVADGAETAAEIARATELAAPHPLIGSSVKRYHKFPDCWEVTLRFRPVRSGVVSFERLLAMAGGGWHRTPANDDDEFRDAVWNPAPGAELVSPRVGWGHLLLYKPGPLDG